MKSALDQQFYLGNVQSIRQTVLNNTQIAKKAKQVHYSLDRIDQSQKNSQTIELCQLVTQQANEQNTQKQLRIVTKRKENSLQMQLQIKEMQDKIQKLQLLVEQLLKAIFHYDQIIYEEMKDQYLNIAKEFENEIENTNQEKFKVFRDIFTNNIIALTKQQLNIGKYQYEEINQTIPDTLYICHQKGVCKKIKSNLNSINNEEFKQIEIQKINTNNLISLYFNTNQDQLEITKILNEKQILSKQIDSFISKIDQIQFNKFKLVDLNIFTLNSQIIGIQGIYLTQDNKSILGLEFLKEYDHSKVGQLQKTLMNPQYDINRELNKFIVYQNIQTLTLDKLCLVYVVKSIKFIKLDKFKSQANSLICEIGKQENDMEYRIIEINIKQDQLLQCIYINNNIISYIQLVDQ